MWFIQVKIPLCLVIYDESLSLLKTCTPKCILMKNKDCFFEGESPEGGGLPLCMSGSRSWGIFDHSWCIFCILDFFCIVDGIFIQNIVMEVSKHFIFHFKLCAKGGSTY